MNKDTVRDFRTTSLDQNGGEFLHGSYSSKVQRGGDSPQTKEDNNYEVNIAAFYDPIVTKYEYLLDGSNRVRGPYKGSAMNQGYGLSYDSRNASWSSDDEYALLSKLTSRLRDHQFNAAVFGAEARSSFEQITDSATRIAHAIRYVKRGDITRAARALGARKPGKVRKDVGSNWLELQYGWLPLLGDAYEAGKAVGSLLDRPQTLTYRQRRTRAFPITPKQGLTGEGKVSKQVIVRMEEQYSKLGSLGLLDPEIVAWELVPYSFVADWFLPIGDFLEYRSVMGRLKARFVVTETLRLAATGSSFSKTVKPGWGNPDYELVVDFDGSYQHQVVEMRRVVASQYNVPLPSFQNPLDLSWKRCVSALALVQQRFK